MHMKFTNCSNKPNGMGIRKSKTKFVFLSFISDRSYGRELHRINLNLFHESFYNDKFEKYSLHMNKLHDNKYTIILYNYLLCWYLLIMCCYHRSQNYNRKS